jgi:hypothetical protein
LMEEFGLSHADLLRRADLIIADADMYYRAEIKALREYIKQELKPTCTTHLDTL